MPIDLKYDSEAKVLIARLSGTVSLEEMTGASKEIVTSNSIPSNTNAIWDVSEMDFNNITYEFQQSLVEFRKKYDEQRGGAKIAILSDYTLAEPLVKMYTILSKDLSQTTQMFTSREAAIEWLQA